MEDTPKEILNLIFSYCDSPSLVSLASTCRLLRLLTDPIPLMHAHKLTRKYGDHIFRILPNYRDLFYHYEKHGKPSSLISILGTSYQNKTTLFEHLSQVTNSKSYKNHYIDFQSKTRQITIFKGGYDGSQRYLVSSASYANKCDSAIITMSVSDTQLSDVHYFAPRISHFICVVTDMDTVAYDKEKFENIVKLFSKLSFFGNCCFIPLDGVCNIKERSSLMSWYTGPTLLEALNYIPKQYKSNLSFHASVLSLTDDCCEVYIHSGVVRVGELIVNTPTYSVWEVIGIKTVRKTINDISKSVDFAEAGSAIELILNGPNLLRSVINHSSVFGSVTSPPREIDSIIAEVVIFKEIYKETYTMQVGPLFIHGIVNGWTAVFKQDEFETVIMDITALFSCYCSKEAIEGASLGIINSPSVYASGTVRSITFKN